MELHSVTNTDDIPCTHSGMKTNFCIVYYHLTGVPPGVRGDIWGVWVTGGTVKENVSGVKVGGKYQLRVSRSHSRRACARNQRLHVWRWEETITVPPHNSLQPITFTNNSLLKDPWGKNSRDFALVFPSTLSTRVAHALMSSTFIT